MNNQRCKCPMNNLQMEVEEFGGQAHSFAVPNVSLVSTEQFLGLKFLMPTYVLAGPPGFS